MTCRGEVAPERIEFDEATTAAISRWHAIYRSIYRLWLEATWYEAWAEAELLSKDSEVNRIGMLARDALAAYSPTTYLRFWQKDRPASCRVCGSSELSTGGAMLLCQKCSISL